MTTTRSTDTARDAGRDPRARRGAGPQAAANSVGPFLASLRTAPARALLLDYDGTLAPLTADRTAAEPSPGVREVLASILAGGRTRVAIVSGRPARDAAALLGLQPRPEIWGSHGLERLAPDGRLTGAPVPAALRALVDDIAALLDARGWSGLLERKPYGFALHARGADAADFALARDAVLARCFTPCGPAAQAGLELLDFDGGFELRPAGSHKGQVVRTIVSELPQRAAIACLGDDLTDEDAFRALGERGLSVLVRPQWRATAARAWLRPPHELLAFLAAWEIWAR